MDETNVGAEAPMANAFGASPPSNGSAGALRVAIRKTLGRGGLAGIGVSALIAAPVAFCVPASAGLFPDVFELSSLTDATGITMTGASPS